MCRHVLFAAVALLVVAGSGLADVGFPRLASPDFENSPPLVKTSVGLSLAAMIIFGGYWAIRNLAGALASFGVGVSIILLLIGVACLFGAYETLPLNSAAAVGILFAAILLLLGGWFLAYWTVKSIIASPAPFVGLNLLFLLLSLGGAAGTVISVYELTWVAPRSIQQEAEQREKARQKERHATTEKTLRAVNKVLQAQMKLVLDKAGKEAIPQSVVAMAGGDAKRARVIWKKLRLKQEFPMSFAEALTPYNTHAYSFVSPIPATPPPSALSAADLPPLPAYKDALIKIGVANAEGLPIKLANTSEQPFLESSTMLLLALQQNRGGAALSTDELGAAVADLNNDGLKEIVDGWNHPIVFFRFPTTNNSRVEGNDDLDKRNPDTKGPGAKFRDPLDPEGLLVDPQWNNWDNFFTAGSGPGPVLLFEELAHFVHTPNLSTTGEWLQNQPSPLTLTKDNYAPWTRYMVPTLVSAGRDGKWGLNSMFANNVGRNPDMSVDNSHAGAFDASKDNIYSYRLSE